MLNLLCLVSMSGEIYTRTLYSGEQGVFKEEGKF